MEERLQKILSRCGVASRRKAEELILDGLVKVNGRVATLGMKADISRDHIKVKGRLINQVESFTYLLFHKPPGCLTTLHDEEGRPTVMDYLKRVRTRVYPVGRLDFNSEGLLILTNDGDLANAILHPRSKMPKTYRVKIDGFLDEKDMKKLEAGIVLEDGKTAPAKVRVAKKLQANSWVDITIHEGRKRQVRRMFERIRHPVIRLIRTKINGLSLSGLAPGQYRYMSQDEVKSLKREAGL
jgi:pseudouridine synthase